MLKCGNIATSLIFLLLTSNVIKSYRYVYFVSKSCDLFGVGKLWLRYMFTVTIQHPHFSAVVHYFISILNNSRYIFNWLNNLMPYTMVKFDMQFHESRSTTLKSGFFDPFYNKMRPHIIYLRRKTKKND